MMINVIIYLIEKPHSCCIPKIGANCRIYKYYRCNSRFCGRNALLVICSLLTTETNLIVSKLILPTMFQDH